MKFQTDHSIIKEKLQNIGAKFISTDFNNDKYFNHPARDFNKTDEALRVRMTSKYTKLTYKGPKFNNKSKSREEIDLKVENEEIESILKLLGFSFSGTVNKEREIWEIDNYVITLDNVEHLGEFVEVEKTLDKDVDKNLIIDSMSKFVEKLGLSSDNQILSSYFELIHNKNS